jgi:hypothetical protein
MRLSVQWSVATEDRLRPEIACLFLPVSGSIYQPISAQSRNQNGDPVSETHSKCAASTDAKGLL